VIRTIGLRAFLRGGYLDRDEPTLVMKHAAPAGLWIPFEDGRAALTKRQREELESVLQNSRR
jgi:hypothetical protein